MRPHEQRSVAEQYRSQIDQLGGLKVMADGTQIPLSSVAEWSVGEGYGSIRRKDQERMATISSNVAAGYNENAVLAEVQATLEVFRANELPPGYTVQYTGQNEERSEAQEFLGGAFLTALLLIGLILVSQFNSVVKPIIILSSVILSTAGVLLGLMVFQMPFVIIMTGLVPLAVGLNFDFFGLYSNLNPELFWGGEQAAWWGPMAVAVIVGILFATFLTLILVPVMYSLVDDFAAFFRKDFLAEEAESGDGGPGPGSSAPTGRETDTAPEEQARPRQPARP